MSATPNPSDQATPLFCARCAVPLYAGAGNFYRVHIEAVADPGPPVVSEMPSAAELRREIKELIAQMRDVSEREAIDQVYRRLTLHFCLACYRTWIENPAG